MPATSKDNSFWSQSASTLIQFFFFWKWATKWAPKREAHSSLSHTCFLSEAIETTQGNGMFTLSHVYTSSLCTNQTMFTWSNTDTHTQQQHQQKHSYRLHPIQRVSCSTFSGRQDSTPCFFSERTASHPWSLSWILSAGSPLPRPVPWVRCREHTQTDTDNAGVTYITISYCWATTDKRPGFRESDFFHQRHRLVAWCLNVSKRVPTEGEMTQLVT